MKRILIVAAHPDDEILGCGATTYKLSKSGAKIRTIILGEGVTSRDKTRNRESRELEIDELRKQIFYANEKVGVNDIKIFDFPDNRFDSVPILDIIKIIEENILDFKPDSIFTHFHGDLNIDHIITNKAVLSAARPLPDQIVKNIFEFEVLSSTGWNSPTVFSPLFFIELDKDEINQKIEAMKGYDMEIRNYPHPRSSKAIIELASYRGVSIGTEFCEAFIPLRVII